MLKVEEIPFFSRLSRSEILEVTQLLEKRCVPAHSFICRKGQMGRFFYAIASGGVRVSLGIENKTRGKSVFLGPGHIFGEMSLLADNPVSATVETVDETHLYVLSKENFLKLLAARPQLYKALTGMLVDRLQHRSNLTSSAGRPICCCIVSDCEPALMARFLAKVFQAVNYYCPGSFLVDTVRRPGESVVGVPEPLPKFFPGTGRKNFCLNRKSDSTKNMFFVGESSSWLKDLTTRWNTRASIQQLLILHVTPRSFRDLQLSLDRNDAVMAVVSSRNVDRFMAIRKWIAGSADFTWVEIEEEGRGPQWPTWRYRVPSAELQEEGSDTFFKAFDRRRYPTLDAIARWITRREIGLSMSAGAAMGFAHLGVIQVLKREGIPIDCVTGASMGGIVALAYGMNGDIDETVRRLRETLGSNRKVRDVTFFPTSSFFAGKKIRLAARRTFGDALITDSRIPSAVVSTDLVHGERVIIDSGPVTEAMLATSAIPAAFPPVVQNDRILVDGALVSRIPVGLLGRRRCGLTIAVNVVPFLGERSGAESSERVKRLRQKFARFFGFREVLASSWVLLGWWQGARDAQDADILLEPNTELFSALNFDRFDEIVTEGRRAAEEKLDLILAATSMVLKPGVP